MAASFSRTAYERLPSVVKRLEKNAQTVCIHLRLRKSEERIARDMGLPPDEVARLAALVRRTLIAGGSYDIISDPVFVRLDDAHIAEAAVDASSGMEEKVLAEKFLMALEKAMGGLTRGERRLLHLFFGRRMGPAEITSFLKTSGLAEDGLPAEPDEVARGVEDTLKKLLGMVNEATPIGRGTLTVKGLKDVLAQTGVEQ